MDDREMAGLEEVLRGSLRHVPAPDGFAERVRERVAERALSRGTRTARQKAFAGFLTGGHRRSAGWTSIAAMLALSAGAGLVHVRHQRQQEQAFAARQEVDYAMQLTTHALDEVEMGVNRSPAGRFAHLLNETER